LPGNRNGFRPDITTDVQEPVLEGEIRAEVQAAWRLRSESVRGAKHIAVLAMRP